MQAVGRDDRGWVFLLKVAEYTYCTDAPVMTYELSERAKAAEAWAKEHAKSFYFPPMKPTEPPQYFIGFRDEVEAVFFALMWAGA